MRGGGGGEKGGGGGRDGRSSNCSRFPRFTATNAQKAGGAAFEREGEGEGVFGGLLIAIIWECKSALLEGGGGKGGGCFAYWVGCLQLLEHK